MTDAADAAIIVQHACMIKPAATWLHSFGIGS
jgi:hypothetical protein